MSLKGSACCSVPKLWVRGLAIGVSVSVVVVASLLLFASRRSNHASEIVVSRSQTQPPTPSHWVRPPETSEVAPRCQCTLEPKQEVNISSSTTTGRVASSPGGESSIKLPSVPGKYAKYASRLFSNPETNFREERFTIVMVTYKRTDILQKVLSHYCKTPSLDKILVIWNDVDTRVPGFVLSLSNSCAVPLKFIEETENKLTNRFKPRQEIETDCK